MNLISEQSIKNYTVMSTRHLRNQSYEAEWSSFLNTTTKMCIC